MVSSIKGTTLKGNFFDPNYRNQEKFQILLRDFENLLIDYLNISWNIRPNIVNR